MALCWNFSRVFPLQHGDVHASQGRKSPDTFANPQGHVLIIDPFLLCYKHAGLQSVEREREGEGERGGVAGYPSCRRKALINLF